MLFPLAAAAQSSVPVEIASLPNNPDGYEVVAYLDCGAGQQDDGDQQLEIRCARGEAVTFEGTDGALGTALFDEQNVEFEILGLEQDLEYVLGFTWWDIDGQGRRQSVSFSSANRSLRAVALPSTPACANHEGKSTFARMYLPIARRPIPDLPLPITFYREEGLDVVVNELWLLKKTSPESRKRVLVVTGDDYPGHLWRKTAPELAAILREDPRLEVTITESPGILASPLLSHYDTVMLHFKDYPDHMVVGEKVWNGLQQYVDSGKGVVLVHFGCGAFQEWPGFVEIAGRVWDPEKRAHDPYGPFRINVVDHTHPITAAMEDFGVTDELYTCLAGAPEIQVLCQATSGVDQTVHPMGFVNTSSSARVFHCTLGHDVAALKNEGTRTLYRRAVAWAAGLDSKN